MKSVELEHPESSDLAFLYGVLFTDDDDANSPVQDVSTHLCVYADKEVCVCASSSIETIFSYMTAS